MDKSRKIYTKALDKYNDGYIDKAVELCEKSISIDLHNAAAINLKGLLMYLKGDIEMARKLWKMNAQTNKDGVSEKYLENSNGDVSRKILYNKAISFIKKLKINEAIPLLEQCSESDFNMIDVNNYLALCYIKKGEYSKSIELLDKVFQIDRNNKMARQTRKSLQDMKMVKKQVNLKRKICISIIIVIAIISVLYFLLVGKNNYGKLQNIKGINLLSLINGQKHYKDEVVHNDKKSQSSKVPKKEKNIKKSNFPYNDIKSYMGNRDYDKLYSELMNFKEEDDSLTINEKVILIKAKQLLVSDGVDYFYNKGCSYLNNRDYTKAKEYLQKAFRYGLSSSIYPDIIYMLGYNLELSGDIENAISYYDKYDKNYKDGSYEETVIYRLALIYRDLDKSMAKAYAQRLVDKYPTSIYNNSVIHSIIGS